MKQDTLSKIKSNKYSILYLLLYQPFIFVFMAHLFNKDSRVIPESWQMTEMLINFQSGFIRRGLTGEIFYQLAPYINVQLAVYIFCFACVLILFYLIIKETIRKGYSILLLPSAFFLSSLFAANAVWVRRDVFIMLLFYALVRIVYSENRFKFIIANPILILGILSHEIFLFISLPTLFLSVTKKDDNIKNVRRFFTSLFKMAVIFLPAFITLLLTIIYSGDKTQAQEIWNSWANIGVFSGNISYAIEAIGWSFGYVVKDCIKVFQHVHFGIYYPIMWTILSFAAYAAYLCMGKYKTRIFGYKPTNDYDSVESTYIILFQLLSIMPLLLVFCDTNRLFFYVIISSYIIRLYSNNRYKTYLGNPIGFINGTIEKTEAWVMKNPKKFLAFVFIIGVPAHSTSLPEHIISDGQIGFFFQSFIELLKIC